MRHTHAKGSFQAGNPLANLLVIIAGAAFIAISVVVSVFAFAVLGSVILVAAAIIGVRVWWLKRRLSRSAKWRVGPGAAMRHPDVIEGEYRVVRPGDDEE